MNRILNRVCRLQLVRDIWNRVLTYGALAVLIVAGLFSISRADDITTEFKSRYKKLLIARQSYETKHEHFPPAYIAGKKGKKLLSWRVDILPFLGEEEKKLYEKFKLNEPWDSPHNKTLIPMMPKFFHYENDCAINGKTRLAAVIHPNGIFKGAEGVPYGEVIDFFTICCILTNAENAVTWTRPDDFEFRLDDAFLDNFRGEDIPGILIGHRFGVCVLPADIPIENVEALLTTNRGEWIEEELLKPRTADFKYPSETIELVRRLGGTVTLHSSGQIMDLNLSRTDASDADISQLISMGSCEELDSLQLSRTSISDVGWNAVAKNQKNPQAVRNLNLTGTSVTGNGISLLNDFTGVERLSLAELKDVKSSDFSFLQHMEQLRSLDISLTPVTDQCLTYLANSKNLEFLQWSSTKITSRGLQNLKKNRPKLLLSP